LDGQAHDQVGSEGQMLELAITVFSLGSRWQLGGTRLERVGGFLD
jgi:hypothetical protein